MLKQIGMITLQYTSRKQIDLTNHNLDNIHWFIAVDNGYELYINGNLVSSDIHNQDHFSDGNMMGIFLQIY